MSERAHIELLMPARAEYVPAVRRVLAGVGAALGLPAPAIGDMNLAITEACTNVVRHAYEQPGGPLMVEIRPGAEDLGILVHDAGRGIAPHPISLEPEPMGIGLPLMASLASRFEVRSEPDAGTSVIMVFDMGQVQLPSDMAGNTNLLDDAERPVPQDPPDGITLSIGPAPLVEPVLERVIAVVAMRADFVIDRITDVQLVAGALAAHASARAVDGRLAVALRDGEHEMLVTIGPLEPGGAARLIRDSTLPGVGPLLERIADEVEVDADAANGGVAGEVLRLHLRDRTS